MSNVLNLRGAQTHREMSPHVLDLHKEHKPSKHVLDLKGARTSLDRKRSLSEIVGGKMGSMTKMLGKRRTDSLKKGRELALKNKSK